jgi:hypothetical protein
MGAEQPGAFDSMSLRAALLKRIAGLAPDNLKEADEFKNSGRVGQIKGALVSEVQTGQAAAQVGLQTVAAVEPSTAGLPVRSPIPLSPLEVGPGPPDIRAAEAAPERKSDSEVSLQEGGHQLDSQLNAADVTDEQLSRANEPAFTRAVAARERVEHHVRTGPVGYRSFEGAILADARTRLGIDALQYLAAIHADRHQAVDRSRTHQLTAKTRNEQSRATVAAQFQAIYADTRHKVEARLNQLDAEVNTVFDQGADQARQEFEDYVSERFSLWKAQRYLMSPAGAALWLKDQLLGLPPEVSALYGEGRKLYLARMATVIDRVSATVQRGLAEAKASIAAGVLATRTYAQRLPPELRALGTEALNRIEERFAALRQSVDRKQDALIDSLAAKYTGSLNQVDDHLAQIKAENRGLVVEAQAAAADVIATIRGLKAMLLSVAARVAGVVDLIITDPVHFLGNLVASMRLGVGNFANHVGEHLKEGFLEWLFGELGRGGVQQPKSFDLKGILEVALQVLGLTYAHVRSRAVKLLGGKTVSRLEGVAGAFKMLMVGGPLALWEWLKDQLTELQSRVLEPIRQFIRERVIVAGVSWIIGLLNPAAAFVKACKAIYDIVMFFVTRGSQVVALVNATFDSVAAIARGAIGAAAGLVEGALTRSIPVAIGFLASLLGLGGLSGRIKSIIESVRKPVDGAIDWVIGKAVLLAKAAGKFAHGLLGKDQAQHAQRKPKHAHPDPAKAAQVEEGLRALFEAEQASMVEGRLSRDGAEIAAARVHAEYPVFKELTVVDGGETWNYRYVVNPGNVAPGLPKDFWLEKLEAHFWTNQRVPLELLEVRGQKPLNTDTGRDYEIDARSSLMHRLFRPGDWFPHGVTVNVEGGMRPKKGGALTPERIAEELPPPGEPAVVFHEPRISGGSVSFSKPDLVVLDADRIVICEITLVADWSSRRGNGGDHGRRKKVQANKLQLDLQSALKQNPQLRVEVAFVSNNVPAKATCDELENLVQGPIGARITNIKWLIMR